MKQQLANRFLRAVMTLAGLTFAMPSAFAATYYWDNNGAAAGFGTAAGTWADPTTGDDTQGWSTSGTGVLAPGASVSTLGTSNTVDAVNFGVATAGNGLGSGTITVSGTVSCGNMTFGSQSGSIVLSGGTINLTNGATGPNLTVNSTTAPSTITSDLTGGLAASFVSKGGNGTLYLSGNNSYLSGTSVNAGVLVLDSANALPGSGLNINGGIVGLGAYGDFTRPQGSLNNWATAGRVHWRSNGGFAAYGAERNVNIGGAGGFLGFGSGNVGTVIGTMNGKVLVLGAADATHKLLWMNGLDVGSATRTVDIRDGLPAVDAELSGGIRGAAGQGLTKTGTGTVLISGANVIPGPLNINAGKLIAGTPSALGAGTGTVTVANNAVLDLNGNSIAGASPLVLNGTGIGGSGSLINSSASASAYAGPVTFGNATIRIDGTGPIALSNPAAITGTDVVLTLAAGGGSLGGGLETGAGTLTVNSTGTWTLSGTCTYTGATSVAGGGLALLGSASINGSSGITVNAPGAKFLQASSVAVTPTVTLTQGAVTGSGTINTVDVGAGTGGIVSNNDGVAGAALTIGTLTFNGSATVNAFSDGVTAPIVTTTLATNAAGTVTVNASAPVWTDNAAHPLIGYGGGSVGGAGSAQFVLGTVSGLSARQVASPTLGDSGTAITLTITGDTPYWSGSGDGKWNLTSANNWSLVSNNSPVIFLTKDNALFNDNAAGAGPISVDIDVADVAPNSTVFNNSTKDYVLGSSGGFGISSGSLAKSGNGKLTINNANTYAGGTTVSAGTLVLGNANAIGSGLLNLNGGNLDSSVANLVNAGNNTQLWNSDFTFVGTESLNLGTGPVTLGGNRAVTVAANNLTVGGLIGGGAVNLTKLGAGTLTLTAGSTFTGTLAVNAGALALSPAAAGSFTMSNALSGTGTVSVNPFAANGSDLTLSGDLSGFTGTVNVGTSGGFSSKLATTGAASSFGAGTVVNIADGATWLNTAAQTGITVNLSGTGNSEGLGALRLDNATIDGTSSVVLKAAASIGGTGTSTISAPISEDGGSFGFTKQGTGTLFLAGANTYSGLTAVSTGVLVLQHASALGTTAGGTTVADGFRVELDNLTVTGEPITITGAGGDNLGALRSRSGNCVWTGPITVNADLTRIGAMAGTTFEVSGVIDDGPNDYRIRFRPNNNTATIIVSGANTYTGGTSLFGGTVVASSFNSVVGGSPSSSFGAPVTEANGMIIIGIAGTVNDAVLSYIGAGETTDRTFQIGDNSATPAAGDNGAGAIENNGTSGPLVFSAPVFNTPTNNTVNTSAPTRVLTLGGTNTAANTISGVIQNNQVSGNPTAPVAITKAGSGSWALAGANTYTGATTVNGGTLSLTGGGSIAGTPTITLASGTTLDVSTPTTPLSLGDGQTLRTGATGANDTATIATAAAKDLTLSAGGLVFQAYGGANGSSANNAPLTVSGASAGELKLNGAPVTVTTTSLLAPGNYVLIAKAGSASVTGTPGALTVNGSGVDGTPSLAVVGGQLVLAIPQSYEDWAGDFPALTDIDSSLDFDGGGLTTGLEWVLGGNPTLASDDAGNAPTLNNSDPNFFKFVFKRRDAAALDPNTKIVVEYGSNLTGWRNTTDHGAIDGVLIDDSVDLGGGFHQVTVSIPKTLAVGGKLFARMGVSGLPITLLSENFEDDDGGFTVNTVGGTPWAYGVVNSPNPPEGAVTAGNSGAKCWGTNLTGGYAAGTDTSLRSPVINLAGVTSAKLSFALAIDANTGHTVTVNIIDDTTDTVIANVIPATGDPNISNANWANVGPVAIPGAALGQAVRIEWRFVGNGDGNYNGAYIDDVRVTSP
ncbi:MAG: autotransporter-associated beta strand repeat-containing protein [Akkermansiaceae bacterium]|jgi:autotransporter-associated beta strand protein|nr:autotransporter-associated beta strand repeat-containing protein [Akkermansiaceae bacterium]